MGPGWLQHLSLAPAPAPPSLHGGQSRGPLQHQQHLQKYFIVEAGCAGALCTVQTNSSDAVTGTQTRDGST